jgi:hypothetical protein
MVFSSRGLLTGYLADELEGNCDWVTPKVPVDPGHGIVCAMGIQNVGSSAGVFAVQLSWATLPNNPAFLGPPPREIAPLVASTLQAANALSNEVNLDGYACGVHQAERCDRLAKQRMLNAMTEMQRQVDNWHAYGG